MTSKTKSLLIKILLLILIILIAIVIALVLISNKPNNKIPKEDNKIYTNKSEKIKKEHCLETLCLTNTKINYNSEYKIGEIEFNFKNKGTETIPQGFVKVVVKDNPEISFVVYHLELKPDSEIPSLIQFKNKKIVDIKDFILEKPTDEEIEEAKAELKLQ